jgi:hypothetical protein
VVRVKRTIKGGGLFGRTTKVKKINESPGIVPMVSNPLYNSSQKKIEQNKFNTVMRQIGPIQSSMQNIINWGRNAEGITNLNNSFKKIEEEREKSRQNFKPNAPSSTYRVYKKTTSLPNTAPPLIYNRVNLGPQTNSQSKQPENAYSQPNPPKPPNIYNLPTHSKPPDWTINPMYEGVYSGNIDNQVNPEPQTNPQLAVNPIYESGNAMLTFKKINMHQ